MKAALAAATFVESWQLAPVQLATGLVAVLSTWHVAYRVVAARWLRWAVLGLLLSNPHLYAATHLFFYTLWEVAFLSALAALALRFVERPTAARLAAALVPAVLLAFTRASWHPLWGAILGGVLVLAGRSGDRRRLVAIAGGAVVLSLVWPANNLVRFGFFAASSWQGFGLPIALEAFFRMADDRPSPAAFSAAASLLPREWADRPALSTPVKPPPGFAPNWNHYALIPLSRSLGAESLELLRRDPSLPPARDLDYYVNGYSTFEGRDPYALGFEKALRGIGEAWALAYEKVAMLAFRPYDPRRTRLTTGFALLFPVAFGACAAPLLRRRRCFGPTEWVAVTMWLCVACTLAMALLVDGAEGDRMRFGTQPFILVLIAWTAERFLARREACRHG